MALGTDGGGSIRIPSSMCGIAGIKGIFLFIERFSMSVESN